MRKIVLTGGPYSGKSTLAGALTELGFALVPEAAIQVIDALGLELGMERARSWRAENHVEFQLRIVRLQLRLEAEAEHSGAELAVCDRGVPDGLAYMRHWRVGPPAELVEAARRARYERVFLLDTLSGVRPRPESGRVDEHDSLRVRDLLAQVYREHDHEPVPVPERSVAERIELIRSDLEI